MADPNIPETDDDGKPTRLMRAEPVVYYWRRRLGDTMWESGFSATPVSDGECTPYIRDDYHKAVVSERDCLKDWLRLAVAHVEDNLADEQGFLSSRSQGLVNKMRAAIAKAEGTDD